MITKTRQNQMRRQPQKQQRKPAPPRQKGGKPNTQGKAKSSNTNVGMRIFSTNVPMDRAFSYKNKQPNSTHVERGCDRICQLTVPAGGTVGSVLGKVMINPLLMVGTRMQKLANAYTHFRVRKATFSVVPSISTGTSGALVAAYCEDPGFDLGSQPNTTLFAQGGTVSSLYVQFSVDLRVSDKKKWYMLDANSSEILNTTQGYFAIALDQATTLSAAVTIPVEMSYEVEFRGAASQNFTFGSAINVSSGTWTPSGAGYTTSATFTPSFTSGVAYLINPSWNVFVAGFDDTTATVAYNNGTVWTIYSDLDNFTKAITIPPGGATQSFPATQIFQVTAN